jgi:hypothetical protein
LDAFKLADADLPLAFPDSSSKNPSTAISQLQCFNNFTIIPKRWHADDGFAPSSFSLASQSLIPQVVYQSELPLLLLGQTLLENLTSLPRSFKYLRVILHKTPLIIIT